MLRRFRVPGGRTVIAAGVCAVLLAGTVPATAWAAPGPPADSGAAADAGEPYDPAAEPESAEAAALSEAKTAGEPVEVLSQRGEAREVFALPDGTLEARQYVVPVWTRLDGEWRPVDLDLAVRADGTVGPKASTVDLTFSGGGEDPLVTLARHGREMTRTWQDPLPEPALDGPVAVYPEVLPGVDLRMEATPDGFMSLLVVNSAQAAANPALDEISFGLQATGLDVSVTGTGGLAATDQGSGAVVFEAPAPLMWDSSTLGSSGAPDGPDSAGLRATVQPADAPAEESAPSDSGRLAVMNAEISASGDELRLAPDLEVLRGQGTEYPVFIDPQDHSPRASSWTMVSRYYASTPQWKFNGDTTEGLGYCHGWTGCNTNEVKRLFYQIDTSRFAGTRILEAEFTVPNTHSAQCVDRPVELWRTKPINSATTWNTQLASGFWIERLRTESFHYGGDPNFGCKPAGDAEFDVKSAVQKAANSKTSTMTFGLRASNETSNLHWKRFSRNAHLRVTYNRPPRQIKMSQLTMEYGGACKSPSATAHVRTLGQLYANNVTDPDGDNLRVQFRVRTGSTVLWDSGLSTAKKSGSAFSVKMPTSIPENTTLNWEARAYDGSHYSPWSAAGNPTACYFVYDTSVPMAPKITSNHYPESDPSDPDDPWYDGVGQYGDFVLNSSSTDVDRYRYGVNGDPSPSNEVTTFDGTAKTVKILPQEPGLHFVTAQSLDQAGNLSEVRTYQFRVRSGQPERAVWALDDAAESTHAAGTSPHRSAMLHGAAVLEHQGRSGGALILNGTDAYATTDASVIDTRRGHTVAAWVKLDEIPDQAAIIVSQQGNERPDFELYYSAGLDRWVFNHRTTDDSGTTEVIRAMPDAPGGVQAGVWTHLAGSYDSVDKQLRLFVDGVLVGETPHVMSWTGRRGLQIGAGTYSGEQKSFFPGAIDDLVVFEKRMWGTQITALHEGGPHAVPGRPAIAYFPLDEGPEASETLGSALVRRADLIGGVETGVPGPRSETASSFDGVGDYGRVQNPHVNTHRSFTVSAWARIDPGTHNEEKVVVAQQGTERPGFTLYYSGNNQRWVMGTYRSDTSDASLVWAGQPAGAAEQGEWTYLVGVHDAVAQTLSLYVNGVYVDSVEWTQSWYADRNMLIGATAKEGDVRRFFPGDIAEVRLYDRVITEHEVAQLFQQSPLLKARWMFDGTGTTSLDASPEGNHLSLGGGTETGFGWVDEGSLVLDGVTGHAATATLPVDTSSSFAVAGWVQATGAPEAPVSVFSASGSAQSAFSARFVPDTEEPGWGSWQVAIPDADSNGASVARVRSPLLHDATEWTHLALVYDGFAKRAELYVNGQLAEIVCDEDSDPSCTPGASWTENVLTFQAKDSFQVGRSRTAGSWGEYWPGAIDDLWVFQGTVTAHQVRQLANGLSLPTEVPTG
jgi:hypothetical protein